MPETPDHLRTFPQEERRRPSEGEQRVGSLSAETSARVADLLRGRVTQINSIDNDKNIDEKSLGNGQVLMLLPINGGYHLCRVTNDEYKAYRNHFSTINRTRDIKLGQSAKEVLKSVVSIQTFGSGEYEKAKEAFDEVVKQVKAA